MSSGITKIEILIVILLALIVIGGDIFVWIYLGQKAHDINVLSDISQIRSSLEAYLTINNFYPKIETATALNDSYAGTEKLCADSFKKITDQCSATLLNPVPNTYLSEGNQYLYQTIDLNYKIEFYLKTNFPEFGLKKGANCATNTAITSNPCF